MRDIEPFLHRNFDVSDRSGDWAIDCPFCAERYGSDDHKKHLNVSKFIEAVHCFRCDYGASWAKLVMDYTGKTYAFALGELYTVPKPDLSQLFLDNIQSKTSVNRDDGLIPIIGNYSAGALELRAIKRYLQVRGFDKTYWHNFYWVPSQWRLYIPIERDYWQARAILPYQSPKYMSPDGDYEDVIFNSAALDMYDEIVICEGALSAIAVGANAIALCGKNPVRKKLERLRRALVKRFIIAVEYKAARQAVQLASAIGKDVILWYYDKDVDPADWVEPGRVEDYGFKTKLEALLL